MDVSEDERKEPIRLYIERDLYLIPTALTTTGFAFGILRGARQESLRFLAENAHRAPKTVKGWYLYQKTKNYRVMFAGLKQGGREGLKLGTGGLVWVGFEQASRRVGLGDWMEMTAGLGTAGVVSAICEKILRVSD